MAGQGQKTAINLVDFGLLRIGVATPEMRVADIDFNVAKIRKIARRAQRKKCRLVLFPELCLTGYTCADLFFQQQLQQKVEEALERSKVKGKNRITLFGDTVSWDYEDKEKSRIFDDTIVSKYTTFESSEIGSETICLHDKTESIEETVVPLTRLVKFQEHLLSLYKSKKMPRGFVHRLIEGQKMFFPKTYNLDKEREEETHNAMIFPYLFYIMNRNLAPDVRQDIQQDLITGGEAILVLRQINIPASMFLMKTRTG